MDLSDWIKCHADTTPDKPAILFEGGEISYARLERRIARCARVLVDGLNINPGDRVAYLGQNSPEQIALLFACARVGAILLPLNWRLAAPEHVQLLQHASPRAIFVDGLYTDHINGVCDQLGTISLVSYAEEGEGWASFDELENARRGQTSIAEPKGLSEEDGLLLCYTSGTTGVPKGALLSKRALACNAANSIDMHAMTAADMVLTVLPMFHVGGLNIQTLPALFAGATVVLHRQFDVDHFYQALEQHPITLTLVVPTIMLLLMADERWSKGKPASLRLISTGSTVVPGSMVSKVCDWGVPLIQVYGSTETCPIAAYTPPGDAARKPASTGKTAKYCEIRIVDEQGNELETGSSGEILVRGPNVMNEYWHDEDATRDVFTDRWLHSGDIGHFDEEGFLFVDGRLKDMIISGGENIYPALIENLLAECDEIEEVAVVGRPDDHWGEVAVAVVVVKDGYSVNAEWILNFCSGRISRFSCPREAVRVDSLPRNAMGKVLKEDVRQMVIDKYKAGQESPGSKYKMGLKIGIDVGGTFTDFLVAWEDREPEIFKVLSVSTDPSAAVINGLTEIASKQEPALSLNEFMATVETIVHGTTVTTNATLTRNGAKSGLITTEGVRDALEMRRGIREEQYNNRYTNVEPLVPRYLRAGVKGRLRRDGSEVEALSLDDVEKAIELFKSEGVEAVSICFMNAFINADHEQRAAELVREKMPDAYLTVSTDLLPSIRFYQRVSTTVLNSYIGPILNDYLEQLTGRLSKHGFNGLLLVMQSNGGVMTPETARRTAALTLLSGPAAGPGAGLVYAQAHDQDNCIVVDMGGTSFEAALVTGSPVLVNEGVIDRHRIALPMLAIHTIGAGGGSIGWIDEGGLLRMGPQSAGAVPGPVSYGQGGRLPACTDANLVLGYLNPDFFAGGTMKLDIEAARAAIKEHIADPLGMDVETAAAGMYRVTCNNMAQGVREVTIKRGFDPREFPMVVAGGAGPIHSCMICEELQIPFQIVPRESSILCAVGMLMGDLKHDFVRTFFARLDSLDWTALQALTSSMIDDGAAMLVDENIPQDRQQFQIKLDCRYQKQYHEVSVLVEREWIETGDSEAIHAAFHAEHDRLYGYSLKEHDVSVDLINVRLQAIGITEKLDFRKQEFAGDDASAALKGERDMYIFSEKAFRSVPVYDGHQMRFGHRVTGPAMIEQVTTAILVSDAYDCVVDQYGSFAVFEKGREDLLGKDLRRTELSGGQQ